MSIPPAFQIGKQISQAFGEGRQQSIDTSAIDEILTAANQSGDPQFFNQAIGQILSRVSPERQGAAIQILQGRQKQLQQQQQQQQERQAFLKQRAGTATPEEQALIDPKLILELDKVQKPVSEKLPLTANQKLTQARSQATFKINAALAPFRNAFGGLELASKAKREELNKRIKKIEKDLQKQTKSIFKQFGIKDFTEEDVSFDTSQLVDNLGEPRQITDEEAKSILQEAGGDREAARQIAKARNLLF